MRKWKNIQIRIYGYNKLEHLFTIRVKLIFAFKNTYNQKINKIFGKTLFQPELTSLGSFIDKFYTKN